MPWARKFPLFKPEKPYPGLLEQSVPDRGIGGGCGDGSTGSVPVVWRAPHEGARFCDACGSALVASVDAAEYKQVTVLFADVVRSMDIAAAVDMERLREIMTELVERSAAVVRATAGPWSTPATG